MNAPHSTWVTFTCIQTSHIHRVPAWMIYTKFSSVTQSCPTQKPYRLQHTRLPCPSPTPGVCSNSCPLSWLVPSSHLILCRPLLLLPSIFPSIRGFSRCWLFASGGQSIEASTSAPVLPVNIQDWFPLALTGLISLQSKELSRVFSNTTVQKHHPKGVMINDHFDASATKSLWVSYDLKTKSRTNYSFGNEIFSKEEMCWS